ncbi:MAG: MG2 domain-containing protein, partial [Bacteroidota bacterium]
MRWILCAIAFSCSLVLSGCFLQDIGRDVVRVEAFSPEGEASPGTNFTVQFSRDLVADSLLNSRRLDGPLAFEPALAGRFQWTAADEVRFYPDAPLAPSTQYRIRVTSDAARDAGYKLEGDTEFTVETPRVRVTSASLNLNFLPDRNDVAGLVGAVEFNYPVDPETAGRFISLQDAEGERVDYRLRTNEPATVMELEAPTVARSDAERAIELQVAEGLTPVGGNMGMLAAFVEPVLLPGQADLKVFNVRPMREAEDRGTVKARFNIPIRLEDAKEFIRVEPAVDYRLTSSNQTLSLRGPFKADETYRVTFKKGLRAIDGTTLAEAFGTSVTFLKEDIPPQIDFAGKGFYLTRSGNLNLGLTTINVEQVTVEVEQVFSNNLVALLNATTLTPSEQYWDPQTETYYYYNEYLSMNALGREIASFDLDLATVRNDEVVTPLNLEPYLDGKKGIFRVVTRERERRWRQATRWVVATDIGLAAKTSGDDLMIWAAGLGSLDAVAGLDLTLRSQNNQSLGTAQTGADGIAVFENVLKRDDGFIPFVVTAEQGDELAFLELTRRRLPTADFDVGGQSFLEAGYEAFLYDERGIYRPGDTVKLAGVVRGEGLGVPDRFPVLLQVSGPDGRLLDEQRGRLGAEGTVAFEIDVPGDARTGGYSAVLSAGDAEIGRQRFSVEEFIPDRMKVSVSTDKDRYNAGE